MVGVEHEAVAGLRLEQFGEPVGDHLGRADELRAQLAGREAARGLAERQALRLGALQDDVERAARAFLERDVGQRLVGVEAGQIDADMAGDLRHAELRVDEAVDVVGALAGDRLGIADHHVDGGQDDALLRRAAARGHARFEVGVERLHVGFLVLQREDDLAPARAELAAAFGAAGLHDHRAAPADSAAWSAGRACVIHFPS